MGPINGWHCHTTSVVVCHVHLSMSQVPSYETTIGKLRVYLWTGTKILNLQKNQFAFLSEKHCVFKKFQVFENCSTSQPQELFMDTSHFHCHVSQRSFEALLSEFFCPTTHCKYRIVIGLHEGFMNRSIVVCRDRRGILSKGLKRPLWRN